jgi:hypothetical protein
MKKLTLIFVIIAVLSLLMVGACGGNGDNEEITTSQTSKPTTKPTTTEPEITTTESSNGGGGGDLTWDDMPVYGGADQIQKGSWSIPADEGGYSKVEWRYYETGDSVSDVIDFYKDKMPDKGWEETMWMDMQEVAWAYYMKNNEKDGAMIWIAAEEGETVIAMMRAAQ